MISRRVAMESPMTILCLNYRNFLHHAVCHFVMALVDFCHFYIKMMKCLLLLLVAVASKLSLFSIEDRTLAQFSYDF